MKGFLAGFAVLWAIGFSADACSCLPAPAPPEAFAKADVVFRGKVESIQRASDHELNVTLRVVEQWKGPKGTNRVVHTAGDSAMCGYTFARGKEYLVYADETRDGRHLARKLTV